MFWIIGHIFPVLTDFVMWWLKLDNYATEKMPTWGLIVLDLMVAPVVYLCVGTIFDALGRYDKGAMHYTNLLLSSVLTVGVSLVVRFFIDYWWIMLIVIGVGIVVIVLIKTCKSKRKEIVEKQREN